MVSVATVSAGTTLTNEKTMPAPVRKSTIYRARFYQLHLLILFSLLLTGCGSMSPVQTVPSPTARCSAMPYSQLSVQGTYSPDRRFLVNASSSGTTLFDTQTQSLRGCLDNGQGPKPTFVFSNDSKLLIVARSVGFPIQLWQLEPDLRLVFSRPSGLETKGLALSPDNNLLAILGWDGTGSSHYLGGTLTIWNVNKGQLVREFKSIYGLQGFTQDSSQLDVTVCTLAETLCGATGTQRLLIFP